MHRELGDRIELPGCVGYHLCGAYLRNGTRKRALRAADETPDTSAIEAIAKSMQRLPD